MSKFSEKLKQSMGRFKENSQSQTYEVDERLWKPKMDENGEASAIIRFLPSRKIEDPFTKPLYKHYLPFKLKNDKTRWIISVCPKTFGRDKECFICDKGTELWNSGDSEKQEWAKKHFRKEVYPVNILVIKDKGNPENEGKIFIYEMPRILFNKINSKMFPSDEELDMGIEPTMVIDPIDGCNFKLYVYKNNANYPTYDKCDWLGCKPIENAEKVLGWNEETQEFENCYDIMEYIASKEAEIDNSKNMERYKDLEKLSDIITGETFEEEVEKKAPKDVKKIKKEEKVIDEELDDDDDVFADLDDDDDDDVFADLE